MRTWFITLPLLCAANVALAQGAGQDGRTDQPAVAPAADTARAPARKPPKGLMAKRRSQSLPTGDLRHCLDLKTRAEVIRCSETRRKK